MRRISYDQHFILQHLLNGWRVQGSCVLRLGDRLYAPHPLSMLGLVNRGYLEYIDNRCVLSVAGRKLAQELAVMDDEHLNGMIKLRKSGRQRVCPFCGRTVGTRLSMLQEEVWARHGLQPEVTQNGRERGQQCPRSGQLVTEETGREAT